jgi:hypothetical protein
MYNHPTENLPIQVTMCKTISHNKGQNTQLISVLGKWLEKMVAFILSLLMGSLTPQAAKFWWTYLSQAWFCLSVTVLQCPHSNNNKDISNREKHIFFPAAHTASVWIKNKTKQNYSELQLL